MYRELIVYRLSIVYPKYTFFHIHSESGFGAHNLLLDALALPSFHHNKRRSVNWKKLNVVVMQSNKLRI